DGDNILNYTNFNFVGNQFANPTVDATEKSNLHVNMYIPADIPADLDFLITIKDFGADQADGGGDDTIQQVFFFAADFTSNTWATLEIPITMANRNNIGLIIYENINNPTTSSIENFYLDNIYFYVP
ncbi:MAG: glycosyl hydrolase family 16, partial [Winogradskyella sp.]